MTNTNATATAERSLASYKKDELIKLVEASRVSGNELAQLQKRNAELTAKVEDLTSANEMLTASLEEAPLPEAAEGAAAPADFCMVGFLRNVLPKKRKDGSVIEGFYKFAVQTTVAYPTGNKRADGKNEWAYVDHKEVWFDCDELLADEVRTLREENKSAKVRVSYRFETNARNVIAVPQKDYKTGEARLGENGQPLMTTRMQYAPDLRALDVEVVTRTAKDGGSAANDLF